MFTMLRDVQDNIEGKKESIVGLKKECNLLDNVGPCQSSIDLTLKDLGIERQVYHGSCFVGNQCHTLLKEKNIIVLCESIPSVVSKEMAEFQFSADICEHAVIVAEKF